MGLLFKLTSLPLFSVSSIVCAVGANRQHSLFTGTQTLWLKRWKHFDLVPVLSCLVNLVYLFWYTYARARAHTRMPANTGSTGVCMQQVNHTLIFLVCQESHTKLRCLWFHQCFSSILSLRSWEDSARSPWLQHHVATDSAWRNRQ